MCCAMHRHAHRAVRLIHRFSIGMTMCQRNRRNRQKGQRRDKNYGLASESIGKVTHTQLPNLLALTDTECLLLLLSR